MGRTELSPPRPSRTGDRGIGSESGIMASGGERSWGPPRSTCTDTASPRGRRAARAPSLGLARPSRIRPPLHSARARPGPVRPGAPPRGVVGTGGGASASTLEALPGPTSPSLSGSPVPVPTPVLPPSSPATSPSLAPLPPLRLLLPRRSPRALALDPQPVLWSPAPSDDPRRARGVGGKETWSGLPPKPTVRRHRSRRPWATTGRAPRSVGPCDAPDATRRPRPRPRGVAPGSARGSSGSSGVPRSTRGLRTEGTPAHGPCTESRKRHGPTPPLALPPLTATGVLPGACPGAVRPRKGPARPSK